MEHVQFAFSFIDLSKVQFKLVFILMETHIMSQRIDSKLNLL